MSDTEITGRYRVLELLGQGGMGSVHRVVDTRNGREVALKRLVLPEGQRSAAIAELFEREYHTLSELAHPRIIEVYDYGVDDQGAYYTMELLTGSDLRELGQVPWDRACALLRDLASSLAIVHSRRLIHCDLSPRNVRCTPDGRAKLLDFGAMMPMGPPKRIVGTPPFIAPELLQSQSLDGRTDLFGLGALGYWMLTGHHAYAARSIDQLMERWLVPPRPPFEENPEVPRALSDLIMECLELEPGARPRSAGVVMERLCAIASLPLEEHHDVAVAYLTTPVLVGRKDELDRVRERLVRLTDRRGAVVVVQGTAGSGRSRFLNACVLEGQLLGRQVIRVNAGDGGATRYGASRSLCAPLFTLAPDAARRAARADDAPTLAHVLDPDLVGAEPSPEAPTRQELLTALRDFFTTATRDLALVVAIDDVDRIDEESLSLLVSLAQRVDRRSLCMILTLDSKAEGSAAVDLLCKDAEAIDLLPLTEEQTEQLIQSVFGEVRHSVSIARRMHSVAAGNPRALLQLATHLVEQGVVRYEAGSFVLPDRLLEQDLPRSLAEALAHRLRTLDLDTLELARALSLTDPRELPTPRYVELTTHGNRGRTFRAIDGLVRIELLVPEGDRYRLGDSTWRAVVDGALTDTERKAIHARIATVFEPWGAVNRRAFHLMRGGQPDLAIRILLAQFIKDPNEPRDPLEDYVPGILDLLEEVADASEHLDIPAALKTELRMKTLGASQFIGDLARFERMAPPLLKKLARDSGLADYYELEGIEPGARLPEVFRRVQERTAAIPESERGLPLFDAMREVSRLCVMYSGVAAIALDVSFYDRIPSLAPFAALSPAVDAIQRMIDSMRLLMEGRSLRARAGLLSLVERLEQPDGAGLGALYNRSLRLGALYMVGLVEASMGLPNAGDRVNDLESEPGHRVNAQRVHMTSHLMRGDVQEAAVAQRRAELVMLQDGQHMRYPGTTARTELSVYAALDDLAGVKEVTERLTKAARTYPKWGVYADLGRCHYRRIQGDFAGALEALKPALATITPLRHRDWSAVAAAHVLTLANLGRTEEALRFGHEYVEICQREDLHPGLSHISQAIAGALLASNRASEARTTVEGLIEDAMREGLRGLTLGTLYELRARIAIAERNEPDFTKYFALCREEYRPDRVAALAVKFQRLMRDADGSGLGYAHPMTVAEGDRDLFSTHNLVTAAHSRLMECGDAKARAECILKILAEHMSPKAAFLYGVGEDSVELLGSVPRAEPPEGLGDMVRDYLGSELEPQDLVTMTAAVETPLANEIGETAVLEEAGSAARPRMLRYGPLHIQPITLVGVRDGKATRVGVAALQVDPTKCVAPPGRLVALLGSVLAANDGAARPSRIG